MSEQEKQNIKFSEKISLKIRKIVIVNRLLTIFIVIALIAAFIGLNWWVQKQELPELDVTESKLYTLSEDSKKAIEKVNQDIKVYVFGINEDSAVVGLIKQYCEVNDKITYEILTKESNLEKVQEFELEDGYSIVVIESNGSKKIIDASTEFQDYDYTTYAQIDTTEQSLTNSILNMTVENKPKVYFVNGHDEFGEKELGVLRTYLSNEALEILDIDIATSGKVPDDCDVLAIMSPSKDFLENEAQAVIDYINKGGNIFLTKDILSQGTEFVNIQKILDQYGVSFENGYVLENDSESAFPNYPYIFKPQISETNQITADIYTSKGAILLAYAQKLNLKSEEELKNLNVSYEKLLETSDSSYYITDFSADVKKAASTAQKGRSTISALLKKTISQNENNSEESAEQNSDNNIESKLIIVGNGRFIADYVVTEVDSQYPLSYLGCNKDFAINAISSLADKKVSLTIRKNVSNTSYVYTATEQQNKIILTIIFSFPVIIVLIGIVIWKYRRKRK